MVIIKACDHGRKRAIFASDCSPEIFVKAVQVIQIEVVVDVVGPGLSL